MKGRLLPRGNPEGKVRRDKGKIMGAYPVHRKRRVWAAASLAVLVGLSILWWQQHRAFGREEAALERAIRLRRILIHQAERAKREPARMSRELHRIEGSIAEIRRLFPATLDEEKFRAGLLGLGSGAGVNITHVATQKTQKEFYSKAEVTVGLVGEREAVSDVVAKVRALPRYLRIQEVLETDAGARLTLEIYAIPWEGVQEKMKPCNAIQTKVRLWPYSKWIKEKKNRFERTCGDLDLLMEEAKQVLEFKNKKRMLVYLEEIAAHLAPDIAQRLRHQTGTLDLKRSSQTV